MLILHTTALFRKESRRCERRGYDLELLRAVLKQLCAEEPLDASYLDHALSGRYAGQRECHIQNDWLLIYKIERGRLILTATRTGSHSDLFG